MFNKKDLEEWYSKRTPKVPRNGDERKFYEDKKHRWQVIEAKVAQMAEDLLVDEQKQLTDYM